MKKRVYKLLAMLLAFNICLGSALMNVNAQDNLNIGDNSRIAEEGDIFDFGTQYVYEGDFFQVIYTLNDFWDGGYNLGVELKNTGNTVIADWTAQLPIEGEISNLWGCELLSSGDKVTIRNMG